MKGQSHPRRDFRSSRFNLDFIKKYCVLDIRQVNQVDFRSSLFSNLAPNVRENDLKDPTAAHLFALSNCSRSLSIYEQSVRVSNAQALQPMGLPRFLM